ncbi:hypothetical protein [Pontibacter rugosus]|uniref:Uncharacterized protein n=1 Tax=Pontibacter rugosus TaxID=1745966 RepID=A0ABW3SNR1_9BACT
MSGLRAELSDDFLRNFLPETIYLVEQDIALPVSDKAEVSSSVAPPAAAPAPKQEEVLAPAKASATDLPKIPKKAEAPKQQHFKVLGQNAKGVVILVTLPDSEFMKLPQLGFLQKILGAIGLKPEDVAYVNNLSGTTARFEDLQQELKVNYIISFASRLDTDKPHDKFTLYNPVSIGAVPVLFSQSLQVLEHDVEHKKLLWGALQKVFL